MHLVLLPDPLPDRLKVVEDLGLGVEDELPVTSVDSLETGSQSTEDAGPGGGVKVLRRTTRYGPSQYLNIMPPEKLIDRVVRVLGNYPRVRFKREADTIEVSPESPDGFHVSLSTEYSTRMVQYEGWYDEFDNDNDDEALNCFMLGLTPAVRLKVTRRGDYDHKWTVEFGEGSRRGGFSTVGLLFFPFWRRKVVVTLQNRWIEAPNPQPEK